MRLVAIDTETKLINYPDQVNPDLVVVSICIDGARPVLRKYDDPQLAEELRFFFNNCIVVGHNIAFDLHVILKQFPGLISDVWAALNSGRVRDTMLQMSLINLAITGDVTGSGRTLADLVQSYLGIDISAGKEEDAWRFKYEELMNTPITLWPYEAVRYAEDDSMYTLEVYKAQVSRVDPDILENVHVHVASHFALRGAEINGIRVDSAKIEAIRLELAKNMEPLKEKLVEVGLIRSNGTQDKKKLEEFCEKWGILTRTKTGRLSSSRKQLGQLQCEDPIYKAYMDFSAKQKMLTTFLPQLAFPRIHPKYNPMVNTLRTSCFSSDYYKGGKSSVPSVNLQQIPRDNSLRSCFLPEEEHKIVCMDYANLELACAAQTYFNFFGSSKMRDVLNTGRNLHTHLGRILYNDMNKTALTLDEYERLLYNKDKDAKMARQTAKPINLGCPGGQSAETIRRTASEAYGVKISLEQASRWREIARDEYPEIEKFFRDVLPIYKVGKMSIKDDDGVFKLVDRYDISPFGAQRARCTYCAAANGLCMQTLGAIGKKIALARIYERCTNPARMSNLYGCRLLIDMHDEIAISCPYDFTGEVEEEMAEIMLSSMQEVLPNMRVAVESMILTRWSKDPEPGHPSKEFHKDPKEV